MTVAASGAQDPGPGWDDETTVDRVVDRLGAHMPGPGAWVTAAQPPADLFGRPADAELDRHHCSQPGVGREDACLRPAATNMSLIVREPRLISAIGSPVAGDLSIHTLK